MAPNAKCQRVLVFIYTWLIISEYDIVLSPMRELRKYGKSNEHWTEYSDFPLVASCFTRHVPKLARVVPPGECKKIKWTYRYRSRLPQRTLRQRIAWGPKHFIQNNIISITIVLTLFSKTIIDRAYLSIVADLIMYRVAKKPRWLNVRFTVHMYEPDENKYKHSQTFRVRRSAVMQRNPCTGCKFAQ